MDWNIFGGAINLEQQQVYLALTRNLHNLEWVNRNNTKYIVDYRIFGSNPRRMYITMQGSLEKESLTELSRRITEDRKMVTELIMIHESPSWRLLFY